MMATGLSEAWPRLTLGLILLCLWAGFALADAGAKADNPEPAIERLGPHRVRIGEIVVDESKSEFTVPGVVLRDEPPLEYLAVVREGVKAYESLLELHTDAMQFNLACILIGLDGEKATHPAYQFDERTLEGQRVDIELSWTVEGEGFRAPMGQLLASPGSPDFDDDWVYVGSVVDAEGRFLAKQAGSLIGIVHDPATLIEDRSGQGIGKFGVLGPNRDRMPPVGTPVVLIVRNAELVRKSAISQPDK